MASAIVAGPALAGRVGKDANMQHSDQQKIKERRNMSSQTKETPILFSRAMIIAILENRKTQTRRVVKPQPKGYGSSWSQWLEPGDVYYDGTLHGLRRAVESRGRNKRAAGELTPQEVLCPYGKVGDRLWVRETFWHDEPFHADCLDSVIYCADKPVGFDPRDDTDPFSAWRKRPGIFMWRWASRIMLEIMDVRVQRVQGISVADVLAEGVWAESNWASHAEGAQEVIEDFAALWDSINAKRGFAWLSNPWVWAITFRILDMSNTIINTKTQRLECRCGRLP